MFTSLFLICNMMTGVCIQFASPDAVYTSRKQCDDAASEVEAGAYIILDNPNAIITSMCVDWGVGV